MTARSATSVGRCPKGIEIRRDKKVTVAAMPPMDVCDVLTFQEDVRTWEDEPLTPEKTRRLQQLMVKAVQIANCFQNVWALCMREGSVWETSVYSRNISFIDSLAAIVTEILTRTDKIVTRTRAKYPEWKAPEAVAEVQLSLDATQEILAKVQSLQRWLNRTRPLADEEMIRCSQESLRHNHEETVSDIVARMNSGGPLVME
jgi:hypothetical protein